MEALVKTFHIDWSLLLAQAVNFALVLAILYKFAYKPVLKVLNDRTGKIEKGLRDAETAGEKLIEMERREKEVLIKAKEEAQKIIDKAEKIAQKNTQDMKISAKEQSVKFLADAKERIEQEKTKAKNAK